MPKTTPTPHLYRRQDAIVMLGGSRRLFDEMVAAAWLRPALQRHRVTLYSAGDIAKCAARLINGDEPPRLVTK